MTPRQKLAGKLRGKCSRAVASQKPYCGRVLGTLEKSKEVDAEQIIVCKGEICKMRS